MNILVHIYDEGLDAIYTGSSSDLADPASRL